MRSYRYRYSHYKNKTRDRLIFVMKSHTWEDGFYIDMRAMCFFSVEKWWKTQMYFHVFLKINSARQMSFPWWRHKTFSALLALCVGNSPDTSDFPSQRPVTRSFDVLFDLRLNQRLSKQWKPRWFETPSRSFWRRCNASWPLPAAWEVSGGCVMGGANEVPSVVTKGKIVYIRPASRKASQTKPPGYQFTHLTQYIYLGCLGI